MAILVNSRLNYGSQWKNKEETETRKPGIQTPK
jgi:hypothetical protein